MNGNSESTSNSMKFAPMPLSALLPNLIHLQNEAESLDSSFATDESDNSFYADEIPSTKIAHHKVSTTPPLQKVTKNIKSFASEKKLSMYDYKKENCEDKALHKIYPVNDSLMTGAGKLRTPSVYPNSEVKRSVLMSQDSNIRVHQTKISSGQKRTPELKKVPNSCQKTKTATPKIKSGIRKFTPSSSRSKKKPVLQTVMQNREKVRCELFRHNQQKDEDSSLVESAPAAPVSAVPVPVPETPMNKKPMPASYVATPSYPQGVLGNNNSKILFKTTSIKDKKYMFIKKLGTGGSSEVYKVLEVGTSSEYAVKCVYLATDQELAKGYINEVRLLRELQNSDRVVRLFDYEYDRQNQFLRMVLEVGETDLSSFLRARGAGLPPALVLHYWEEMLHAVLYIHDHGVIHADLKPANFLLVCGRLKLIDFGIASAISGDATSVVRAQAAGTYSYISPEALMGGAGGYGNSANIKISFRSDVWSLGCILYSMVYGRTPFGHIPNLAKLAAILDPNHKISYPPAEHIPSSIISTLKWCLTYNARSRPSVRELLNIKHLQPARQPLPQHLLEKVKQYVSPEEFKLLKQAQI